MSEGLPIVFSGYLQVCTNGSTCTWNSNGHMPYSGLVMVVPTISLHPQQPGYVQYVCH